MNEFKFLSEKNIDYNIVYDYYIYEEFFLCIFKKKIYEWLFIFIFKFLFIIVLNFIDFVNEIYKVG